MTEFVEHGGARIDGAGMTDDPVQPLGLRNMQERYRILAKLGSGGMADVFLAIQLGGEHFQRFTVIKRMRSISQTRDENARMFINEARVVASLNHPHIVKVFDLGWLDQDLGIAMEYVDGESLQDIQRFARQQGSPIPLPVTLKLMIEAAEALHYAHSASGPDGTPLNLIHRDVGPQNLLLTSHGYLKVIDFGVAKSTHQVDVTTPGLVKGKIPYFAPETLTRHDLDGRADLYALGLVMFEMLTQEKAHPFTADASIAEVVNRITSFVLPPVSAMAQHLPREIDAVVAQATRINRDERFQTGAEFAAALRTAGDATSGVATTAEVETWFRSSFAPLCQRRREFERHALAQAERVPVALDTSSSGARMLPPVVSPDPDAQTPQSGRAVGLMLGRTPPPFESQPLQTEQPAPPPRSSARNRIAIAAALILGLIGGGIVAYSRLGDTPESTENPEAATGVVFMATDNLFVESVPAGALVFINGERVGNTGESGINLRVAPQKTHDVLVRREGYADYRLRVTGEAFGQRQIVARLSPSSDANAVGIDDPRGAKLDEPAEGRLRDERRGRAELTPAEERRAKRRADEDKRREREEEIRAKKQRRAAKKRRGEQDSEASVETKPGDDSTDEPLPPTAVAENAAAKPAAEVPLPPPPPPMVKPVEPPPPSGPAEQSMNALMRRRIGGTSPEYPKRELERGVSAEVVVKVRISPNGEVTSYDFVSGPKVFQRSVSRSMASWKFSPLMRAGKAVETLSTLRIAFRLGAGE